MVMLGNGIARGFFVTGMTWYLGYLGCCLKQPGLCDLSRKCT